MTQQATIRITPASQPNAATAEGSPSTPAPIMAVTLWYALDNLQEKHWSREQHPRKPYSSKVVPEMRRCACCMYSKEA